MAIEVFSPSTAVVPYDLSAYSIPFGYSWPTPPNITSNYTVSNSAQLAIANVNGARITLQAGSYGDVSPANDQEWVLQSGALIDTFTYTGSERVKVRGETPRVGRIGTIQGPQSNDTTTTTDILFDGIYQANGSWTSSNEASNGPGGRRIAIINSSLNTASYTIFCAAEQADQFNNLIIAGNFIRNDNSIAINGTVSAQHAVRIMTMNTFIFVGNYIQKHESGHIWRVHCNATTPATDSYNGFMADNTLVQLNGASIFSGFQIYPVSNVYTPGELYDMTFIDNEFHSSSGGMFAFDMDAPPAGWNTNIRDMTLTNNFANGSDGLNNVAATFPSFTISGNTSQAYSAGSVPTPASKLGWTP